MNFADFMKEALKDKEPEPFKPPSGFPMSKLASLTGGSAPFGSKPRLEMPDEKSSSDRAGKFFEEEMEELDDL